MLTSLVLKLGMEILYVLFAVVAAIWAGIAVARGGLLAGALLVMLAGVCFGHALFVAPVGALPLTSDRILLVLLIVQYLIAWRLGRVDRKSLNHADVVLLGLIVMLTGSTLLHDWNSEGGAPIVKLGLYYLMPLVVYWIARNTRYTERTIYALFGCLGTFGVYLAVTAIGEYTGHYMFVFPKYIVSPTFSEYLGRARGPMLNPAANGMLLVICWTAMMMWWPRVSRFGQLALLGVSVLYAIAIYGTLTRSAWLGALASVLIVVGLSLPRFWRVVLLGGTLAVGAVFTVNNWHDLMAFKRDKGDSAEITADSAMLRPVLAAVAWQMFQDNPLWGVGFGQYSNESTAYLGDRSVDLPLEKARPYVQHNVFLSLLTETGLVGMLLFSLLLLMWAGHGWRLWFAPDTPLYARQMGLLLLAALGTYVTNGMFQDTSIITMANMILFYLAGVARALPAGAVVTVPQHESVDARLVGYTTGAYQM